MAEFASIRMDGILHGMGWLPILNFILVTLAFATSYSISQALGFVDTPWPFISDTGTIAPASCWFGLLLSLAAYSMGITFIVRFLQIREHLGHDDRMVKILNIVGLAVGWLGVTGIEMVATFQETQALTGHLMGALVGFSSSSIYGLIQSCLSVLLIKRTFFDHKILTGLRFVLTAICFIGLIVTKTTIKKAGYSLPPYNVVAGGTTPDPPYKVAGYYYAATVSEWTMAFSFFFFVLTFIREFSTVKLSIAIQSPESLRPGPIADRGLAKPTGPVDENAAIEMEGANVGNNSNS